MNWHKLNRLYPDAVSSVITFLSEKYNVVRGSIFISSNELCFLSDGGLYKNVVTEDLLDWMMSEGFYLNLTSEVVGSKVFLYYWFLFELKGEMFETERSKGVESYQEVVERVVKTVLGTIQKRKRKASS